MFQDNLSLASIGVEADTDVKTETEASGTETDKLIDIRTALTKVLHAMADNKSYIAKHGYDAKERGKQIDALWEVV